MQPDHNSHYIVVTPEAYLALEAAGSNKVYLYLCQLESQEKAELSHWCNNLTRAGPGCRDSHQTDKDVHKRIYIGCHRVYRSLSGTYRCDIHAHAQQHTDTTGETDTSHAQAKFLPHSSSLFMLPNWLWSEWSHQLILVQIWGIGWQEEIT